MTPNISSFLQDLYEIDPDLKSREKELIPLIQKLLKSDPGREPDAAFVQELRERLLTRAAALSHTSPSPFLSMSKFLYALTGAVAAVVIVAPAVYYGTRPQTHEQTATNSSKLFAYSVTDAGSKAFGSLSNAQDMTASGRGGGGGGSPGANPTMAQSDTAAPLTPESSKLMAPYEITQYEFSYTGALPTLSEETVSVLKRQKSQGSVPLSAIANAFDLKNINIQSFAGSTVDSVSFSQNVQFGYTINVQLKEGAVMLSQNWEKWPHPEMNCKDEACYRQYRTALSDIPDDATLIGIADAFVKDHGIDLSTYGKPEVDNSWKRDYDRAPDKSQAYVPDAASVLYPLIVDGRPVFDSSGTKAGIRVNVNVKQKRVSDMWGMQSQSYLRSSYDAVTSGDDIQNFLKSYQQMPITSMPAGGKVKTVKVELGEPTIGFATYYTYENQQNDELIVPALIFPVKNVEGDYYWQQNVIVPLAKELLKSNVGGMGGGIMPMMR